MILTLPLVILALPLVILTLAFLWPGAARLVIGLLFFSLVLFVLITLHIH